MDNKSIVLHGAMNAGAWAWEKYGDKVVERVLRAVGHKIEPRLLDRWKRMGWAGAEKKYRDRIKRLCGTTTVLGKAEPIPLDRIYTEVYILDLPTAYRRYDITDLENDPSQLSPQASTTRVSGLSLVQYGDSNLFILGKPGAGKTTFLRYLALQCAKKNIDKIPILVGLKEWADSGLALMAFISQLFDICGFPAADEFVEYILDSGYALVLFDGLDEVKQEDSNRDRTIQQIRNFTNKYLHNRCVVSCRVAATSYTFEHFKYIEIADFTPPQIFDFARKWFSDDKEKYSNFSQAIVQPENKGMLELASVPILLTLICLSFSATGKFPRRRVQVYEEGIETLLTRWDASKNVSRDYFGLSVQQKRLLLSRIAFNTLIDKKLFFPQNELSDLITKFLHTIPGYETKIIDSEDILRSIEAHHGLLSERTHSIYSFSHLTFQEYFAAKEVVHDKEQTTLFGLLEPNTVASDRWREVILMTATLLPNAVPFFERFEIAIWELIRENSNIDELFFWADRKAQQNFGASERVLGRLQYLSLAMIFDGSRSTNRDRARLLQEALTRAEQFAQLVSGELTILKSKLTSFPLKLNKDRADNVALQLNRASDLPPQLRSRDSERCEPGLTQDAELASLQFLTDLVTYSIDENPRRALAPKFAEHCRNVGQKCGLAWSANIEEFLVETSKSPSSLVKHNRWVRFADDFRDELIRLRDVGHNWRLTKENIEVISRILQATGLLHECLRVTVINEPARFTHNFFSPPAE